MHLKDGVIQATGAGRSPVRIRTLAASSLRVLSAFLVSAACWSAPAIAQTSAALQDTSCAGTRQGGDLGCTANEFTVDAVVEESSGTLPTCTIGGTAELDLTVHLLGSNTDRQDAGLFIGQNGNDPQLDDATASCSVATLPTSPAPFESNDGDACGDFNGGGDAFLAVTGVKVACQFGTDPGDPLTYGKLLLPYTLTYYQNNGVVCNGPDVVTPGTTSKCTAGVGIVEGVTLTGFLDITKQTVPDGDLGVFDFTATNTVAFEDPTDASFTLTDGQTHRIEALVDVNTQTISVTEALEPGWNSTATISCVDYLGQPVGAWVTTNGATRTITAALDIAHPAVACTITNVKGIPLTVNKTWVNGIVGNVATLNTTGAANNVVNFVSTVDAGSETDTAAPVVVTTGEVITITEVINPGSAANYTSALSCTGTAAPVNNTITVGPGDTAINCTWTNTRRSATLTMAKAWSNAEVGDSVNIDVAGSANALPTFVATAGTPTETDTDDSTITVFAGEQLTLTELFTVGLPGAYASSLACSGTTGLAGSTSGSVLTVGAADTAITCTFTNARTPINLTVRKSWQNAVVGETVTVSTTGAINNAELVSTAETPTEIDTDDTVTVFAGEQVTIGEIFAVPANAANYDASLSCSGNATPLAGNVLTVTAGDTAIVCTQLNARLSATLTVAKSWTNAVVDNVATITGSGGISPIQFASTANTATEVDTSGGFSVFVGEQISLTEVIAPGVPANYAQSLACTGNNTQLAGNVLTVNAADDAITCTFSNVRGAGTLTLAKTWVNAQIGESVTFTATGGSNANQLVSAAAAANETDTGAAVAVFTGEAVTLAEAFAVPANAGNYVSGLACTGLGQGDTLVDNVLTFGPTPGAVTCTYTNTRAAGTLTLRKSWLNARIGEAVTVNGSGGANPASLASTAGTPTEIDASAQFNVSSGEVITITETFGIPANAANYTSGLACTGLGNGTTLVGNVLTVGASPGAIVCTQTNARRSATLTPSKSWVSAFTNDAVAITTTGAVNNVNFAAIANTPTEIDSGAGVTVFAGEQITFAEAFSTGSQANYATTLACSGNATALAGNVLTVSPGDTAISCRYTNTRIAATLTLRKTWVNAIANDAVTVSGTGGANDATLGSVANSANETDTGAAAAVLVGEQLTISEAFTTGVASNYASSLSCTGNATPLAGNVLTVTAGDQAIVCTQVNSRIAATLTLRKTWVNATVGNAVTVSGTGGANPATLASVADTANETDTGVAVTVLVGDAITITEAFTTGSASGYTSTLACTGNAAPLEGSVLTVSTGDVEIVCTQTNSRNLSPLLNVTKTASPTTFIVGQPASYTVTVTNGGEAATSANITLADPLPSGITLVNATGTNWSCSGTTTLSCTFTGTLAVGASTSVTFNVSVAASATNGNNTATASGGGDATCPAAGHCIGTVLVPIQQAGPSLAIVKSANPVYVNAGSLVLYTLHVTNIVNYDVIDAEVRDMPPNGLAYVPGSGTIYDDNAANNAVTGARPIMFHGVDVEVGQTIRIQYLLRAGAALAAGSYTNYAQAFQEGQPISNIADFTVYAQTGRDPLLEQTRILGKVFDDQDGDGWQDPGERGVPGVRIASVDGLISETDAHGRYHQEGIVLLNQERGKNYILKLDAATLPPGSSVTTENPLLRRVTAAIPARFDFGVKLPPQPAAAAESVDMALGEINFTPGSVEIRPEYQGVLDEMAGKIRSHQSGEVFIDSATGNSPLAFERAGRVREQLIARMSPEEQAAFTVTVRLQASDGTAGQMGVSDEVKLGEVFFDTDKSTIRPEFEPLLDSIARSIEAVGSGRVSIVGHADLRASTEYNQALGMRRANSVFEAIAKRLSPEARTKLSVEVEGAATAPGAGQ
jgi:uncharacterized repeat protein (TIGR01451 family)